MSHTTSTRTRGIRLVCAVTALSVVALLTLAPRSIVAPARGQFMRAMDAVTSPLLVWIPYGDAEQILNTMMFVPFGATIALLLHRRAWPFAILTGALLSAAVEYLQESIPGRVTDPADVLWNSVGAAIGVALVTMPRMLGAAVTRARQSPRTART